MPGSVSSHDLHADRAIEFIQANRAFDAPWFLSVNFYDPHHPFDPPAEYLERALKRSMKAPAARARPPRAGAFAILGKRVEKRGLQPTERVSLGKPQPAGSSLPESRLLGDDRSAGSSDRPYSGRTGEKRTDEEHDRCIYVRSTAKCWEITACI